MATRILLLLQVKRLISHFTFQTVLTYHLSSVLLVIANISGHLTINVTLQLLQLTVHNAQSIV